MGQELPQIDILEVAVKLKGGQRQHVTNLGLPGEFALVDQCADHGGCHGFGTRAEVNLVPGGDGLGRPDLANAHGTDCHGRFAGEHRGP